MAKFKTRARALDMLGRQQIAGIPTAISELFKNAHDAYADRVEVDYYRSDRLFVLRDDGIGMTRDEFESRWLTIGTESKLGAQGGLRPPPSAPGKPPRPILGEKGIGRLAIAAVGPQVLILTRAVRGNKLHDTVAAYIHWRIFEMPGIDLDEIEIPVRTFPAGSLPTQVDLRDMIQSFDTNVTRLSSTFGSHELDRFRDDFSKMQIDPSTVEGYVPDLSLHGDGHGTHFLICPANEILEADIDDSDTEKASNLEKLLLGFTNTMTPGHQSPVIKTAFRDHRTEETYEDLVNEELFFTPEEFENADHHVQGRFDEYGQFIGSVSIYGETYRNHRVSWPKAQGKRTLCGPFEINVATVQGVARESTLPLEEHARLIGKMNRFGGLYIYKDGIRILPYGDTDYDWLEIEKRRTFKASYYFFSYRRIFGVVELSSDKNGELSEKAGREGFRENRAYRQFRDILKHFFVQLAADFFRSEGTYADRYEERKSELDRLERARARRKELVTERRRRLASQLENFFSAYDAGKPQQEATVLTETVRRELHAALSIADPQDAAASLLQVESTGRRRLRDLEERYRITKPRGVGVSQRLQRDYDDYSTAFSKLHETVFSQARSLIEGEVSAAADRARIELDRRIRIELALQELAEQARRDARSERSETHKTVDHVRTEVREAARHSIAEIDGAIQSVLAEFAQLDVQELDDARLVSVRDRLESSILSVKEQEQSFLRSVRAQLEAINLSDDISQLDQLEALEQRNLVLEEQADLDLQLTQLGMAIEVINHEFDSSIRSVRGELRRLKAWADINQNLEPLYRSLRTSFDHLDGYLSLFTPLHRRLYRQEVEIAGTDISTYLGDLFQQRLRRHSVQLVATKAFLRMTVRGYPSSFYPVFVNLIDNAIFWLRDHPHPRIIRLDAHREAFLVSNNGPEIPERHWRAVFEQGITFKPGGRGLGLFISSQVLDRTGYTISLVPPQPEMHVTFRIAPKTVS